MTYYRPQDIDPWKIVAVSVVISVIVGALVGKALGQPAINPNRCAPVAIVKQVYEGTTDYVIPLEGRQAERVRAWWKTVMPDDTTPSDTLILVKRADGAMVLHFGPPQLVCSGIVLMPERAMELLAVLAGAEA